MKKVRVLSLFSGIGAFEKALSNIGIDFELVNFCEIDKFATKSYCAIHNVNESLNLWDITKIDIDNLPKDIDLITHGSPCQDFSLAGKQAGGDVGSETRSSLMWNTVNIVKKANPKYIIWENVKNVLSKKHIHNFENYINILEKYGYNSYHKVLNAKNFGIPQNRERLFVVSVRKDVDDLSFQFPEEFELKLKLIDMLDKNVDEKYYLSDCLIDKILNWKAHQKPFQRVLGNNSICPTLTARGAGGNHSGMVILSEQLEVTTDLENKLKGVSYIRNFGATGKIKGANWCCCTLTCAMGSGDGNVPIIKESYIQIPENTKKGYKEAYDGDGVYINRPHQKRGCVQKGMTPTIKANGSDIGVVTTCVSKNTNYLTIRKLTPKECFRLMGFKDEEFEKIKGISDTQLYKQAGNSIVVNVLEEIFKNLFKRRENI